MSPLRDIAPIFLKAFAVAADSSVSPSRDSDPFSFLNACAAVSDSSVKPSRQRSLKSPGEADLCGHALLAA